MKQAIREYSKKCFGAWRIQEISAGLVELENNETGEHITYELTGWASKDNAYIDDLCGYKEV